MTAYSSEETVSTSDALVGFALILPLNSSYDLASIILVGSGAMKPPTAFSTSLCAFMSIAAKFLYSKLKRDEISLVIEISTISTTFGSKEEISEFVG